jgi:hypothetical protein
MAAKLVNLKVFLPVENPVNNRVIAAIPGIVTWNLSIIKRLRLFNYPQ